MPEDQDLIAVQQARSMVDSAHAAWEQYRNFSQDRVDAVVERIAEAGRANALRLAEMAVEETGYGNVQDKFAKNLLNADFLPRAMRGMKTIGVIREDTDKKLIEIGTPLGVVAAIVPTTNPTSTVICKVLISLKAGNGIVLSPHPNAKNCTGQTASILARAAVEAGAPEGLIQCLTSVTLDSTRAIMRHPKTAVILATGGHGLVRAAYSSGKPAFGVGPGNVPVLLEKSFDVAKAVAKVVEGKSFDYGTVCSSEQSLVTCHELHQQVLAELRKQKAFICSPEQGDALGKLLIAPNGTVEANCVGQSPTKIARMAGFEVPQDTSILVAEVNGVGKDYPLSREKLSPVLALYIRQDFQSAMDTCESILRFGGLGHTCVIYSNDDARIREFALRMPANRVLVNTPSPQGSVGLTTNVWPSMTLGCGAAAGNATSDNVGPQHLFNIKRLAYAVRETAEAIDIPDIKQAAEPVTAGSRADVAAMVVDRFIASKTSLSIQPPSAPSPVCAAPVGTQCNLAGTEQQVRPSPSPEPPIEMVDFVCEQDVREAIQESRKIFIGPKSIITPSARELAAEGGILVLAERS